ncbi:TPA: 2-oxo-3-hexenedioate decarboxylase [Burkholderia vietnamiensis]|uniref:2-oxo-3-hexenedioate decarboxylase n=1 Tax=Burkholderia vietnamiensis TaxID=60552 RepID=UPI00264B2C6C|nr:2-oxo-3-hexenedioate decarboxylase [Burkholderia vietnamiensis]MDN8071207.1 2-oxo-3-hexenedioate decarboxylase [Burkholderia vietnamiensis]HDR9095744.1 2-oxo-3-hexenedioate decarboxylase [Burkholderia vietnamiensis]HDR9319243.1 2-oxo-3-hexenedioate decarboxylase [Burkholderia vietnamiensis]
MALDSTTIAGLAEHLESCHLQARDTNKITDEHVQMTLDDAYAVQDTLLARKLTRGARLVGWKAGLTSPAKMKQMGVTAPCFGFLVDEFAVPNAGEIEHIRLIHPKVEPEICFVLKHALKGPGCHIGAVLAATDFVLPGIEVIDSRYRDFKFDLPSVIADNTSASHFVIGDQTARPDLLDLRTLGVVLERNGWPVALGAGAAVLGHPAAAVAMLANHLGARGQELPAGALVLSGGVTEAVAIEAGDHVSLRVQGLGSVSVRFR